MSKNLYVGNLSFQTTADDLREAFGQYGTVTAAQVIAAVQAAVASGNLDALASQFEADNERGCPLDRAE